MNADSQIRRWQLLVDTHNAFGNELADFVHNWSEESAPIVKEGLKSNIRVALAIVRALPAAKAILLLPDLLYYARSVHGHLEDVRQTILSIPRDWLLRNIESAAEPLLSAGDDEDYRRFLELYLRIDSDLARRLARAAANASIPDIRDLGEEFLQELK